MPIEENLAELAKIGRGRYLLVNVIMRRSRELYAGAKPLVKPPEGCDAGDIAYQELLQDHLKATRRKAPTRLVDLAKKDI